MKRFIQFITTQTSFFRQFLAGDILPSLEEYGIEERPRRNVQVKEDRRAEGKVVFGTEYVTRKSDKDPNVVETVQANRPPESSTEVVLDEYDIAYLDDVVGTKWRKSEGRAKVIKWFWLKRLSAAQIEQEKTDKKTKKLETGFSERTVADYIKAYYDADDARAEKGKPRQRESRFVETIGKEEEPESKEHVVEW